ncbi:MAG: phytanoyl-CoA dioxygenase family protein [Pseudomonadota bacterium]|nr:phytanoyl-CoA dioxygenase family protein [Pseudomonadota bacterium]
MLDINQITTRIKDSGFLVIDNFCDVNTLKALRLEFEALIKERPSYIKNHEMTKGGSILLNMVPARVQRSSTGLEDTKQIRSLFEKGDVTKIAQSYHGCGWGVSNYIYQKATHAEFGEQELFQLHFDNFMNCQCLKGFIYLEDCLLENGALRYIPNTHKLVRKVFRLNPDASSPTQVNSLDALVDTIDRINLKAFTNDEQSLIAELKAIVADPKTSLKYTIERKAGALVLFDTIGVHGGVSVAQKERWIARFHLVDRKYRFWNHPEQENFLMGLFSRFCRKIKTLA